MRISLPSWQFVKDHPMLNNTLLVTVYGLPAPQGSKRHVGNGIMIEDNPKTHTWREDVKLAALRAMDETPEWTGDYRTVILRAAFAFPRPKSHYRTGKNAHLLRDDAPHLHVTKPDLDKLLRSTGDALTAAGVYRDDCRVASVRAIKRYVASETGGALDRPGARLYLWGIA